MDILNIDEILNSDSSSGFFDEDNQEDVINILQQWKQGMRDTIPNKPDTRTFTRVKQKLFNTDYYYNKFDNEDEKKQNDFDCNRMFDYNELYHPKDQYDTLLLNDISPPISSSFIEGGNQQLNKSLINSNHFKNMDLLNSIDSNINIERTFQLNSSSPSSSSSINNQLFQLDNEIKCHNEIFDTLSISGIKDFNIAQTDEMSQLYALSTNSSTTESNSEENIFLQNQKSSINGHDPHHTFTKEESDLIKENFRSNKPLDNLGLESTFNIKNNDLNVEITNNSKLNELNATFINNKPLTPTVFSDKTFKKKSKIQQQSFNLHEHIDDDDDFENVEMVINGLNLNNSKDNWDTSNSKDKELNDFLLHSTPFQNSIKTKNATEQWSNLVSKHLNYDDDDDTDEYMQKNIDTQNSDRFKSFTREIDKEIDCLEDDIKIKNYEDYQDVNVEIDDDYNEQFNTSVIKMKQSLDNIKKRHFSQKQDKKSNDSNISNKKAFGSPMNSNRLLIRRSRLYENLEPNFETNLHKNIKMTEENGIQKSILDSKKEISLTNNEDENLTPTNTTTTATTISKMSEIDDDNYKNENQFKTMIISRKKDYNIQKNLEQLNSEVSDHEDNKKFESIQQQQHKQKQETDNQNVFKEPAPVTKNPRDTRILQRPKYVTRYFRQNPEIFQKANSAGDLNKASANSGGNLLNEKQNNQMENITNNTTTTKIAYKAKSFHNLAMGNNVGTSDEIKFEPIRYENKTAVTVKKSLIPNATCDMTNNRSSLPYKTRLIRPSSGYYSSDVRNPLSYGFQQNLSVMHDSSKNDAIQTDRKHSNSSISSTSTTVSNISNFSETNSTKNNEVTKVIQSTTTSTAANNKPALRVKRSGLPRPSSVVRR